MTTYNPRGVKMYYAHKKNDGTKGTWHLITGYAEDSFITIEDKSNGVTSKVGCDGEVVRAVDASRQHTINLNLLQYSHTNTVFDKFYVADKNHIKYNDNTGIFSLKIEDLAGRIRFETENCWITKETAVQYGRDTTSRQWTLETDSGHYSAYQYKIGGENKEGFSSSGLIYHDKPNEGKGTFDLN